MGGAIGFGITSLENASGYRCCLGFVCAQAGVSEFKYVGDPDSLDDEDAGILEGLLTEKSSVGTYRNNRLTQRAMDLNDDPALSKEGREKRLTALFNEHGLKLKFIGEYNEKDSKK